MPEDSIDDRRLFDERDEAQAAATDLFRAVALANPITWQVDVLRFATMGYGDAGRIALESLAFVAFTAVCFGGALWALRKAEG